MTRMTIEPTRYASDPECATPEGLKARFIRELTPVVAGIKVQRNRVLVATYVRPNVTAGGIILTEQRAQEDRWQGKVGLVLKVGSVAFDYDEVGDIMDALMGEGEPVSSDDARSEAEQHLGIPQVGDWVAYRTSESYEVGLQVEPGIGCSCRFIYDDAIICVLADPTNIW